MDTGQRFSIRQSIAAGGNFGEKGPGRAALLARPGLPAWP